MGLLAHKDFEPDKHDLVYEVEEYDLSVVDALFERVRAIRTEKHRLDTAEAAYREGISAALMLIYPSGVDADIVYHQGAFYRIAHDADDE